MLEGKNVFEIQNHNVEPGGIGIRRVCLILTDINALLTDTFTVCVKITTRHWVELKQLCVIPRRSRLSASPLVKQVVPTFKDDYGNRKYRNEIRDMYLNISTRGNQSMTFGGLQVT